MSLRNDSNQKHFAYAYRTLFAKWNVICKKWVIYVALFHRHSSPPSQVPVLTLDRQVQIPDCICKIYFLTFFMHICKMQITNTRLTEFVKPLTSFYDSLMNLCVLLCGANFFKYWKSIFKLFCCFQFLHLHIRCWSRLCCLALTRPLSSGIRPLTVGGRGRRQQNWPGEAELLRKLAALWTCIPCYPCN